MYVSVPLSLGLRLLCAALGASSIVTLLMYFYGVAEMTELVPLLLIPSVVILLLVVRRTQRSANGIHTRIVAGLWAGGFATLAYDVVRLPIALSGVPVFKAISYFGTLITNQAAPTVTSELVGWSYHLSNGIGFGLIYAILVGRPRWWTAVVWGTTLEVVMLLTPYAEVFGYKLSSKFMAITLGSHVVYGLTLWAALRPFRLGEEGASRLVTRAWLKFLPVPLGVGIVGAAFFAQHSASIPPPPPPYLGKHLYVTWNVPEPDRIAGMWVLRHFVDPQAQFHFIEPYTHFRLGTSFDIPEAETRRSANRSVTEVLLAQSGVKQGDKLKLLARMANLYEVSQWMRPSDPQADAFGKRLLESINSCDGTLNRECAEQGLRFLEEWYENRWD